ncbi:MAG: hypothetical protein HRJ53_17780 [Acidobacteria bacterium Pan2503]|uniref:Uncharacterized protein n=1 Tax=Candidatus Acidiferrum panamense TaxID=2741543 RepID=A0A7V8SXX9_9BACT|nr:hypothetical protein [Candidatus Acidoferrum panamensis]
MAGLFSRRFLVVNEGIEATYTPPDGSTAVVRSIIVRNAGGAAPEQYVVLCTGTGTFLATGNAPVYDSSAGEFVVHLDLRFVFYGGEALLANGGPHISLSVSGYLFAG